MASTYAVRRRLLVSLHRPFIDRMKARMMHESVAIDALVLAGGDEERVHEALDYVGVNRNIVVSDRDCTRMLARLRQLGGRL